jgi:hypothetical protein
MIDWRQLVIEVYGLDRDRLLSDWRWLVPNDLRPISLTIFGDWFLEDPRGCIWFLDVVGGKLSQVSMSCASFLAERENPENLSEWYMADFALLCWERGLRPTAGQCLSFKIPPVLSGPIKFENIEVCDLMVHESIMGQIHRGVKDLPEGTVIDRFTVDGEVP